MGFTNILYSCSSIQLYCSCGGVRWVEKSKHFRGSGKVCSLVGYDRYKQNSFYFCYIKNQWLKDVEGRK